MGPVLRGHGGWVRAVAVRPDVGQVATGSEDKLVRLWEPQTGEETARLAQHTGWVSGVDYSPDGSRLASASHDRSVLLWDLSQASLVVRFEARDAMTCVRFSPDGRLLAAGCQDKTVRLWDLRKGVEWGRLEGHPGPISSISFSPDGMQLAVAAHMDTHFHLWDLAERCICERPLGHQRPARQVCFVPNATLASAARDGAICLWNTATWLPERILRAPASALAFAAAGQVLLSGGQDSLLRGWDVARGVELWRLEGHKGEIASLATAGECAVTGGADGTARIWRLNA
ncbi:MAG: WD40 repeat domain-containing protein [Candidatus Xenobia bacterium]